MASALIEELNAVLSGKVHMENARPSIASWARYFIYEGAMEVLRLPRAEREGALAKIPQKIRPYVEAEAKRVWPLLVADERVRQRS